MEYSCARVELKFTQEESLENLLQKMDMGWEATGSNSKAAEWTVLAVEPSYLWYWKIKLSDQVSEEFQASAFIASPNSKSPCFDGRGQQSVRLQKSPSPHFLYFPPSSHAASALLLSGLVLQVSMQYKQVIQQVNEGIHNLCQKHSDFLKLSCLYTYFIVHLQGYLNYTLWILWPYLFLDLRRLWMLSGVRKCEINQE